MEAVVKSDYGVVRERLKKLILVIVDPVPGTNGTKVVAECIGNRAFSIVDSTGAKISYKKNDPALVGARYTLNYELVL